jgi:hypothetical protein
MPHFPQFLFGYKGIVRGPEKIEREQEGTQ